MKKPLKVETEKNSNLGWTIKGIELETRIAVQKAAKKEGMTLGKYCNTKLREASNNTLKSNTNIIQVAQIQNDLKLQIEALKQEIPNIVRDALETSQSKNESFLKRIFK